ESPAVNVASHPSGRERLPALFGRRDELAALGTLLTTHALVTIVGPGGIGKTSLAAAALRALSDGGGTRSIAWVDLAPLSDLALIASAIAASVGVVLDERRPPLDALLAALKTRSVSIVLDNCEHLVEAIAKLVAVLIEKTNDVRFIATSQLAL